jgi:hypothetical protein
MVSTVVVGMYACMCFPADLNQVFLENLRTRGRCYGLKIISVKKLAKKSCFFDQTAPSFFINLITRLFFLEKRHFFAENCDHNIDPRLQSLFLFILKN